MAVSFTCSYNATYGIEGQSKQLTISGTKLTSVTYAKLYDSKNSSYTMLDITAKTNTSLIIMVPETVKFGLYSLILFQAADSLNVGSYVCYVHLNISSITPLTGNAYEKQKCSIYGTNLSKIGSITFDSTFCEIENQDVGLNDEDVNFYIPEAAIGSHIIEIHPVGSDIIISESYPDRTIKYTYNVHFEIGKPLLMNDIRNSDLPYVEEYNNLISDGKIQEAYLYLKNTDVSFFDAATFNDFEKRIYILQKYIKDNETHITAYGTLPDIKTNNMIWIHSK